MAQNKFKIASSLFAFLLWGEWAYVVNGNIVSALLQGSMSFAITLAIIALSNFVFQKTVGIRFRVLISSVITVSCTGLVLAIIHYIAGTKEIFYTISPPLTIAFLFSFFINLKSFNNHERSK